jgi:hypothetical protein
MKKKRFVGAVSVVLAATFALGYLISRARASGIPASMAMTYSGVLTDTSGTPLTGSKNILVQLYDQATGGTTQCTIGPSSVTLAAGAFSIPLPDSCTAAVHAATDLWVDVFVDGASLGRSKLGAVPYAVEADHATAAGQSSRLLLSKSSQSISVGTYCGSTAATNGIITASGGLTGYAAARALCVTACSSPTAHMCSGVEMTWTVQLGVSWPAQGWVATGSLSSLGSGNYVGDCIGWTNNTSGQAGGLMTPPTASGYVDNYGNCATGYPILCCD